MESFRDSFRSYLAEIGREGGRKSRRRLSSDEAKDMVRVREARRAFRKFYARCFWDCPPKMRPRRDDVTWIANRLREHGGREGWEVADRLCR